MKQKLLVVSLGLLLLNANSSVLGQESFRIQRGMTPPDSVPVNPDGQQSDEPPVAPSLRRSPDSNQPVQGGIERTDMQAFADQGAATQRVSAGSSHTIVGGVQKNDMQAFADQAAMMQQTPMQANLQNNALHGRTDAENHRPLAGGITQEEIKNLGRHDIVLLIDKSSSMRTPDCPGGNGNSPLSKIMPFFGVMGMGISRWQWCGMQTMALAQQYISVAPTGLSVVLFSWGTKIFPHVNMADIPTIFQTVRPEGMTNEAAAVRQTFEDYFTRKNLTHGNVKPLLVAVITDGLPTNKDAVREALIQATTQMQRPDEIKVTFLQVGSDPDGASFVREMQHNLVREGAKFPIASSKVFAELERTGLTRALVDCISEH